MVPDLTVTTPRGKTYGWPGEPQKRVYAAACRGADRFGFLELREPGPTYADLLLTNLATDPKAREPRSRVRQSRQWLMAWGLFHLDDDKELNRLLYMPLYRSVDADRFLADLHLEPDPRDLMRGFPPQRRRRVTFPMQGRV
jgi:hypothetical protein